MTTLSGDSIRILHVDDEPDLADLVATFLEREDDRFSVETATSASEGTALLRAGEFDCVVSDYEMPGRSGIEFLDDVREEYPDLPFVLYTGKGSEEVASDAISAGVTDYLQKEAGTDQYTVLANRIANAVEHDRSRRRVERSERRLREIVDSLPHVLYVVSEDGTYLLANEALADFHDLPVAEIEGAKLTDVLDESVAERLDREHRDVLESDAGKQASEFRIADSDGETHVFEPEMLPYDFADADERAVLGIGVDVTERRERERTLERTRERMRLALDHARSIVFELNCDTGSVVRHGTFEQFFDVPSEESSTVAEHVDAAVHPEDREEYRQFYGRVRAGEIESGELEYRTNPETGDVRWIRDDVSVDASGDESRQAIGVARDVTERKERKLELQRTERRYQAIFNDPNILVGLIDTDGTVLDINETAMEYVEVTREALIDAPFWETPWFDHSASVRSDVKEWIERAASGNYVEFEVDLVRPDGEPYTIQGVFRPVRDADGEVVSLVISDREVTGNRRRERELERTNALLSTLFDTLPVGVLAEDGSRNVLAANQRVIDQFGLPGTPEELVGADCERMARDVSDIFVDPDGFVERVNELVAEREPVRGEPVALEDGRTIARTHQPIELPDRDGHLWVYRDVTDRTEHERRLQVLNETTRRLMGAETRDAVAEIGVEAASRALDLDANAIHFHDEDAAELVPAAQSDASTELIGPAPVLPAGDSIAWRVFERGDVVVLDDVQDDPDVFDPDSPFHSELFLPLGEYGLLIAGSTTTAAFDQRDVVLGEILAGNVATALEQVEQTERLRDRERELTRQNDRLAEFVSVVSHDLRNPLNVAAGSLELATDECESDHLDRVATAHDRMDTLIDDLLTLARDGDRVRETEPVDLAALSRDRWRTVDTADATLACDTTRTVRADRSRLGQLLENCFRNAVKHGGDDVAVRVGDVADGFVVEDDGPGIPPDQREAAFDAGFSTSDDGTGFGLSIVKQVADTHGWNVAVTERDGGGARFEIAGIDT